jgi:hypothetical protein
MIALSAQNKNRWYELAWWLVVITLPFPDAFNNASIILLGLIWLTNNQLFKQPEILLKHRWGWPFFFYFGWICLGLIYTHNLSNGIFTVEKKISFLALPMIAITGNSLNEEFFSFLKRSFVYACLFIALISLAVTLYNYSDHNTSFDFNSYADFLKLHPNESPIWSRFSYIQLIYRLGLHPTYFSMYLAFCLVILLSEDYQTKWLKRIHLAIGFFIAIFLALLASRSSILVFFMAMIYLLFIRFKINQGASFVSILSVFLLFVSFLWLNPVSRFRLLEEPVNTSYHIDKTTTNWNSVNFRLLEWQGSWSAIEKNIFLGVGTGGWYLAMSDFYSHYNKSTVGLEHNAHNQYLQTWMENGLPGLMLFLFCLLFPFLEKKLTSTHIVFLLIFSLMCLTESIGERQKGIVFFTLFQTLFTAFDSAKR